IKRGMDLVVASLALVVLAPVLALVALLIKLDSAGPVLFRQTRHGFNQSTFRVFKFRSMSVMEDGAAFTQA
ncbi:sugar transferase, partial [Streptococcus pneumoniae]|uniref:sugar transferase n=1 Tax=Streptococcus pneumoniae TaxID=1313 RepID=UPI001EF94B4B